MSRYAEGTSVTPERSQAEISIWKSGHAPSSLLPTFPKALTAGKD